MLPTLRDTARNGRKARSNARPRGGVLVSLPPPATPPAAAPSPDWSPPSTLRAAALPVAAESITFEAESSIARPLLRRLASSTCHSRKPGSTCRQPSERRRSRWDAIHGGC